MFAQSDVAWSHLLDEELLIAMPQSHRLATKRTLNLRQLSSEPFLALSPEHTLRIIFNKLCADSSFLPKIAFEGNGCRNAAWINRRGARHSAPSSPHLLDFPELWRLSCRRRAPFVRWASGGLKTVTFRPVRSNSVSSSCPNSK